MWLWSSPSEAFVWLCTRSRKFNLGLYYLHKHGLVDIKAQHTGVAWEPFCCWWHDFIHIHIRYKCFGGEIEREGGNTGFRAPKLESICFLENGRYFPVGHVNPKSGHLDEMCRNISSEPDYDQNLDLGGGD